MEFEVLSPRADVDPIKQIALNPRVTDLNKATIGLYSYFKAHWALILEEIANQLQERYPGVTFTRFHYGKDLNPYTDVAELAKDPEVRPRFEEWVKGVDAVLMANGDAGSCTLYLTYNGTLPEHLGKPTVITVAKEFADICERAAELRGVPRLRYVKMNLLDLSMEPDLKHFIDVVIPERVAEVIDEIIASLTEPLTTEEAAVPVQAPNTPRVAMKGSLTEVNKAFYKQGWAYGMPIMPPTREAVDEMLTGTDLPRDHVVARIPPLMGNATVEKIAVNGVMAGCLPTHMPVLIAAVEAMVDPGFWLEAYTCSMASWAPLMIINGPVRKDLALSDRRSLFSPYKKGNAAIASAFGLMIMNLARRQGRPGRHGYLRTRRSLRHVHRRERGGVALGAAPRVLGVGEGLERAHAFVAQQPDVGYVSGGDRRDSQGHLRGDPRVRLRSRVHGGDEPVSGEVRASPRLHAQGSRGLPRGVRTHLRGAAQRALDDGEPSRAEGSSPAARSYTDSAQVLVAATSEHRGGG